MSQENKGGWFLKALGMVTVVGILIAVGRIVLRVFSEEEGPGPGADQGV